MKLNLGSGFKRYPKFLNVDIFKECNPDVLHDLEKTPYPFKDNSCDEILFNHSLEHIGQKPSIFLGIMKEIYRICQHEAIIRINVPHPRHDNFLSDPTHVRAITPLTLQLFDLEMNHKWQEMNAANSPFAMYLGVNYKLISTNIIVEEYYVNELNSKRIKNEELMKLINERNNVATEYRFILKVIK